MKKLKWTLHNMFIAVGFGTMVYVPMLLLDKGLNDTMQSVLTWVFASVLYGLSFEIIEIKSKIKYPIHIAVCFIITIATRLIYSYIENGTVNVLKTVTITIPIFVGVYIALYLFMKYIGNVKEEN
jgi:hypothetical protein